MANLLDLFFPKRCVNCKRVGDYLCSDCFSRLSFDTFDICPQCSKPAISGVTHPRCKKRYSLDGAFSAIVLNNVARKLIYQLKYRPYLTDLRQIAGELMFESFSQNEEFQRIYSLNKEKLLVVPIPLFTSREKKRGYNQSEILAKEFAKRFGLPFAKLLVRVKDTKTQVKLDRSKRRQNIKGAFLTNPKSQILNPKHCIFLIDDVLTTGATLSEAGKVLKKAGAGGVWGIALAKEK
ncbi:MAG: Phosphoribosyltransferase [Candidatus Levybacteria bacterium GW2011_GWA2_40_8]|nr:MAG: Phosphoribosyltransferase [Candidatus Levybacteria bacterium GW2011_GWA2_40_8]